MFTYGACDVCAESVGDICDGDEEARGWERVDLREGVEGVEQEEELDRYHSGRFPSEMNCSCIR